jgi:hypothetical protein
VNAAGRAHTVSSSESPPVASPDGVRAPAGVGVLASRTCPVCLKVLPPRRSATHALPLNPMSRKAVAGRE